MCSRSRPRKSRLQLIISLIIIVPAVLLVLTTCNMDLLNNSIAALVQVPPPVFSVEEGTYSQDIAVEITCELEEAAIYYTTDFSIPTSESTLYSGPVAIDSHGTNITLRAVAMIQDMVASESTDAEYLIMYDQVTAPVFSHDTGIYNIDLDISLTCSDPDATIHYTTDGSPPDLTSTLFSTPIEITGSGTVLTINAVALKSGFPRSEYVTRVYEISYPQVATPTFSQPGGAYTGLVTISCAELGADIYYGINGPPVTLYTDPVAVSSSRTTINAQARKADMDDSLIASVTYN